MKGLLNSLSLSNVNEILLDLDRQKKYVLSSIEVFNRLLSGWASLLWTAEGKLLSYLQAMIERAGILCDLEYYTHPQNYYWVWQDNKTKAERIKQEHDDLQRRADNARKTMFDWLDNNPPPVFEGNAIMEDMSETRYQYDVAHFVYSRPSSVFERVGGEQYGGPYYSFKQAYPNTKINKEGWGGTIYQPSAFKTAIARWYYYGGEMWEANKDYGVFPKLTETGVYGTWEELLEAFGADTEEGRARIAEYFDELHTISYWYCDTANGVYGPDDDEDPDVQPLRRFNEDYSQWVQDFSSWGDTLTEYQDLWMALLSQAADKIAEYGQYDYEAKRFYEKWLEHREQCRKYVWGYFTESTDTQALPKTSWNEGSLWSNEPEFRDDRDTRIANLNRQYCNCDHVSHIYRYDTSDESDYSTVATFACAVIRNRMRLDYVYYLNQGVRFYEDPKGFIPVTPGKYALDNITNLAPYGERTSYGWLKYDEEAEATVAEFHSDIPEDLYGKDIIKSIRYVSEMPDYNEAYFDANGAPMDFDVWKLDHIIGYEEDDDGRPDWDRPIYDDPTKHGYTRIYMHKFSYLDLSPAQNLKDFTPDYGITDWLDKEYPGKYRYSV